MKERTMHRFPILKWLVVAGTCAAGAASAQTATMDGKEVRAYEGTPRSINEQQGKIVIQTATSEGNWSIGPRTVILFGRERESIKGVEASTRVQAWVSTDGFVHRINILEMRLPPGPAPNYSGEIVSLNEEAGQVEVKTERSVGHWKVGAFTVVGYRGHRIPLGEVLHSKRVGVAVLQDGRVERIDVQEMK
jgi:hypothetical protein